MSQHIVMQPVEALKPYGANARTHSRKQIKQIADGIGKSGTGASENPPGFASATGFSRCRRAETVRW